MNKSIEDPGEELDPDTLLIRLDCVRPGQVLLTFGGGLMSEAISLFSGGPFSHAAVVVSPLHVMESYDLISNVLLEPVGFERVNGVDRMLAKLPHAPREAGLFEHPDSEALDSSRLPAVYDRMMERFHGQNYSPFWRLVAIAQLPGFIKSLAVPITRMLDDIWLSPSPVKGPFCSELVAEFFSHLGLSVLKQPKKPCDVTPNDLAVSNLRQVKEAIIRRRDVTSFSPIPATYFWSWGTQRETESALRGNELRRMAVMIDGAEDKLREIVESEQAELRSYLEKQAEKIEKLLRAAEIDGRQFLKLQVALLFTCFVSLSIQLLVPVALDPKFLKWRNAAILNRYDIGISQTRCTTLIECGLLRKQGRGEDRQKLLASCKKTISRLRTKRAELERLQASFEQR